MIRRGWFFAGLVILPRLLWAQTYPSGLDFEDEVYAQQPVLAPQEGGKSIPSSVDLSPYCPISRHQGSIFSCVGWSVGYGAFTIERAIQQNMTDRVQITNESSSALFVYNQIKIADCNRGARISDALQFLQEKGDCLAKYFDKNLDDCTQTPSTELWSHAARYKISDYAALFTGDASPEDKVLMVRRALAAKKPVIIGLRIRNNFYKLEQADYWYPELGDTTYAGGHAMVIVGYDDTRGACMLFNSWGTKWGRNGFIWVKYKDLGAYLKYAYVVYLGQGKPLDLAQTPVEKSSVTAAANIPVAATLEESALREVSGQFQFMQFTGQYGAAGDPLFEEVAVKGEKQVYQFAENTRRVGDKFQIHISPEQYTGYIYALSVDASGKAEVHWPKNEGFNEKFKGQTQSALAPFMGGFVRIPGPNRVMKLTQPGLEQLIVLFSEKKIQPPFIQYLKENLASAGEALPQKLNEILGTHGIPVSEVHFNQDAMQFKAITRHTGAIIPVILQIRTQ